MKLDNEANTILVNLGFTQLESEIYTYLLIHGTSTGYGVAKGVDKAVANVYKAIESLSAKGAVEQTSGKKKQCVAVPWKQLIASQRRKFDSDMSQLEESFKNLPSQSTDEQVYQLKNFEQLRDYAAELIENAQHVLLADIEPNAVDLFKPSLIAAAKRGVEVIVKVYEPVELTGVETIVRTKGKQVYGKTNDVQLSVCSDGSEVLIALLSQGADQVIQAFKTRSSLMSLTIYNKLLYEFTLTRLKQVIPNGDIKAAQKILTDTEHLHPFSAENKVLANFKSNYETLR